MGEISSLQYFIRRAHKIAKSDYQLRHVRPSVCPSVRMQQFGSPWYLIFELSSKICPENSNFIKIR